MPIFEYICQECQHEFETLVFGRDKAECIRARRNGKKGLFDRCNATDFNPKPHG